MIRKADSIQDTFQQVKKEEQAFREMLPTKGFIGDYMRYTDRQESPDSYHGWVALTILSGALQRNVWVDKGMYKVYPNIYTVLVSASGRCRKSRAISLGISLLQELSDVNILADKTTPEALLEGLGGKANEKGQRNLTTIDNTGFIQANEFAVFINKQTYNQAMVPLLTTLFDSPDIWRYKTRTGGQITLRNVTLSMLGGSTPEWLASDLPENAFEGGFMSRVIFVVREHRNRIVTWPEKPPQAEVDKLKATLMRIKRNMVGSISLDKGAMTWFDKWYHSSELKPASDYQLTGFIERKPDLVLKIALLLAVSEERKEVNIGDMRTAYNIITWTQDFMFAAFKSVGMSRLGQLAASVIKIIDSHGGKVSKVVVDRRLAYQLQNGKADMDAVLELLKMRGDVTISTGERKPGARGPAPVMLMHNPRREEEDEETPSN